MADETDVVNCRVAVSRGFTLIPYYEAPEIRLCPKARRTVEQGGTLPWTAWDVSITDRAHFSFLKDPLYKIGSYGINWWVNDSDLVVGAHDPKNKWRRTGQKSPDTIPVLMDCGFILTPQSVQGRPFAVALEILEVVSVR